MKLIVNLAWIVDMGLILLFIAYPTYMLVIADNYITDPAEVKAAVIMIIVGLLVLSPVTWVLSIARKALKGKR